MTKKRMPGQSAWLTMAEAMAALARAGKHPEEASAILLRALALGVLLGRAQHVVTEYTDGTTEYRDHIVPAWVWANCPLPPLGHDFWRIGDLQVRPAPLPDGSTVDIGGQIIAFPLGGLLPITTIRGLKVSGVGVLALCRALGGSKGLGRRRGVGGYAKADEPLVREMHQLRAEGSAASIHAAAVAVAPRAKGSRQFESKVRRLVERYRATFPDAPLN